MIAIAIVTILAAGLFCGGCVYITFVEHPARMERGTEFAAREFAPSLKRSRNLQRGLAILATLGAMTEYALTREGWWLAGALTMFAILPYTWMMLAPINRRMVDPSLDLSSQEAHGLLRQWGVRHSVRDVLSFAAAVIFLLLLSRR